MHSQCYAIPLLDLDHLLADDAPSHGLAQVLRNLAPVNLGHPVARLIDVVSGAGHAIKLRVVQAQAIRQTYARERVKLQQVQAVHLKVTGRHVLLPTPHLVHHVVQMIPPCGDAPVGLAILLDDVSTGVVVNVLAHVLQLGLELGRAHAVATAEHRGLADEPLVLGDRIPRYVEDDRRHVAVDVLLHTEQAQDVELPCQPRENTGLDLR